MILSQLLLEQLDLLVIMISLLLGLNNKSDFYTFLGDVNEKMKYY